MPVAKPSAIVPMLRFPEFGVTPGWQLEEIGPFLQECSERVAASTHLPIFTSSRLGLQPQEEYYGGNRVRNAGQYGVVPPGCIVYRHMSDDGVFAFNVNATGKPIAVSRVYPVFRCVGVNTRFLQVILNHSPAFKAFAIREKTGSTRTSLHFSRLRTWITHLPSPSEQQKIADCLGSLDDLIAAEDRKLEALRQHKQGLMQQLFPQPGETVPRLRFPEFRKEGAWVVTAIGNIGEVITGSTPSTSRRDFYGGDFMFVSPADISDLRFVEETKTTLTEEGFEECRAIKKNSVLFVCIGSTIGKVAQCSRPCVTNQQINALVAGSAFVADFAYYLLARESARIARLAGKQAVPIINKSLFASVKVAAPAFAEQQKIADCLGSLDDLITAQAQELEALRKHKQGLMQQLFPSLDGQ